MLNNYFYILIFITIAFVFAIGFFVIAKLLSNLVTLHTRAHAKREPYECGFEPFSNARIQFNVRYYFIAVLFLIFDVEMALLFPWAMVAKQLSKTIIIAMSVFLGVLALGLFYEWKKGALEWD